MEDSTKKIFEQGISEDTLGVIISFLPERLQYRSLCKSVNSSIVPEVTHLVVKNEKKLKNLMLLFPNIRYLHFQNDQMNLEEIKKVFQFSTFPNLKMLDLSLFTLKKEDERDLSCVPFCWKEKKIEEIKIKSQKDWESLFYISLSCVVPDKVSFVMRKLKNPSTRLVNYSRIFDIVEHLQKNFRSLMLFMYCPFLVKPLAEKFSSEFFTKKIWINQFFLFRVSSEELKEHMDCHFLIEQTAKTHSLIGLSNLIQFGVNIFDNIEKSNNRLLTISENEEFFVKCALLSKIPNYVFSTNEFILLMKSLLFKNKVEYIIKFTNLGFDICSLPEFEPYLLQLLKESKLGSFCRYLNDLCFQRIIYSLNTIAFVDIIESNYMNLKMEKVLFQKMLENTNFFGASCKMKKSWIWDYVDTEFPLLNENNKFQWMKHVSVNCEEFDNLLIKHFNLDTLFSIIEQYHYIPIALFNLKSFDEALFNYIKKNYTSLEKLKLLESFGYNIQRIGTLTEISLNFGELQTEIIRYFFHKGPRKVNSNSPQEIQKNFLIEEVEEEETFDYDQIEFEYEEIYSEDENAE
jgi:hypothetical protein